MNTQSTIHVCKPCMDNMSLKVLVSGLPGKDGEEMFLMSYDESLLQATATIREKFDINSIGWAAIELDSNGKSHVHPSDLKRGIVSAALRSQSDPLPAGSGLVMKDENDHLRCAMFLLTTSFADIEAALGLQRPWVAVATVHSYVFKFADDATDTSLSTV